MGSLDRKKWRGECGGYGWKGEADSGRESERRRGRQREGRERVCVREKRERGEKERQRETDDVSLVNRVEEYWLKQETID